MRLAKSIEMVLGLVASGGVVLVLSGGAYAADGGVGTVSQTVSDVSSAAHESQDVASPSENNLASSDSSDTGDTKTSSIESENSAHESVANARTTTATSALNSVVSSAILASASTTVVSQAADANTVKVVKITKPVVALGADAVVTKSDQVASDAGADKASAQSLPTLVDPSDALAEQTTASITLGNRVLEIQPKITTMRTSQIQDLAASIPTAADQGHSTPSVPEPAKSTGLFTRLTSELAGSVVPPHTLIPTTAGVSLALLIIALMAGAALTGRVGTSFGATLRQGGYVHAARSDVADNLFSLLFATPMSLSYVTANQPTPSSFLMVSESKTESTYVPNAIRKEEMK